MKRQKRRLGLAFPLLVVAAAACAEAEEGQPTDGVGGGEAPAAAAEQAAQPVQLACTPSDRVPVEGRLSPYDSVDVPIGDAVAKICYGRPSLRGRTMIGGEAVPYGRLWRTGANEPTILHLPVAAEIAGMRAEPGSYSIYTIPGQDDWVLILNRSTSQWGHESQYTEEVRAQEVGRATVSSERLDETVETFTIRAEPGDGATQLLLEWQDTRVRVPIRPA